MGYKDGAEEGALNPRDELRITWAAPWDGEGSSMASGEPVHLQTLSGFSSAF